jgi:hypothetical protein
VRDLNRSAGFLSRWSTVGQRETLLPFQKGKQRPGRWTCHGDPICMTASCGWWNALCPVLTSSCAVQRNHADTYGSIVGI